MSLSLFHQAGHNFNWNFESYREDKVGDGVIIAPRYMAKDKVDGLPASEKPRHIFDPQFFIPSFSRGKLETYPFFPSVVATDFSTAEYTSENAEQAAKQCVDYQALNHFKYIVIPCRYLPGVPDDFIEKQESIFVAPFSRAIRDTPQTQPVLLQLVITSSMLKNETKFHELLTWITGMSNISGLYLIFDDDRQSKQIRDVNTLYLLLKFIDAIKQNDLSVLAGYTNTEGLILSVAGVDAVTVGSYEAQRCFNCNKFGDPASDQGGQPNPRIYIPALFQWVDTTYLNPLRMNVPDIYASIPDNKYKATMFKADFKWHFGKPALYKHYFLEFSNQLNQLSPLDLIDRYIKLQGDLIEADNNFKAIADSGVYLPAESDGAHLPPWITAINMFAKDKGWR